MKKSRFALVTVAALLAVAGIPANALGSTVTMFYGAAYYAADSGEQNVVWVVGTSTGIRFMDGGATITSASGGCVLVGSSAADCPGTFAVLALGDRNDVARVDIGISTSIDGGDGNDHLLGGPSQDHLYGGFGNDRLEGRDGEDRLAGQGDDDVVEGGDGRDFLDEHEEDWFPGPVENGMDALNGGPGYDTLDYVARATCIAVSFQASAGFVVPPQCQGTNTAVPAAVRITQDGLANDGAITSSTSATIEGDNVSADIEALHGTPVNDSISGGPADNYIEGRAGNDTLFGGAGDDDIRGVGGNDDLRGGEGADMLAGGDGGDHLLGGGGVWIDTVSYMASQAGVTTTFGDAANDGAPGEGDMIQGDVERVFGSNFDDTLIGNPDPNVLAGFAGNDVITGGGGSDRLYGYVGNDTINANDGIADHVDCGPDADTADIDPNDVPTIECEQTNDAYPPRVTCTDVPPEWTRGPVTVQCTATDDRSPPATPASFSLTASLPDGQESGSASTNVVRVCDALGNCVDVSRTARIDRKGPAIFPSVPAQGQHFLLNEYIVPAVTCTDGGSGVQRCGGLPFPPATLDTSSVGGGKTVRATAKDVLDNHSDLYITYSVGYGLRNEETTFAYGEAHVFFSLADANGLNVSDPQIEIYDLVLDSPLLEQPRLAAVYEERKQSGFVIAIPLDWLPTGTHRLLFTAGLDPAVHVVEFEVP